MNTLYFDYFNSMRNWFLIKMEALSKENFGWKVVMWFFHGDSPARQFECGQQKGGHYYCSVCSVSAKRVFELDYSFRCQYMSLAERQKLVLKGPCGKKNSLEKSNKPLQHLDKPSLVRELTARGIYEGYKKNELEDLLKEVMHGVQRVPTFLYNDPMATLESINCSNYKILGFDPLHGIWQTH